MLGPTRTREDGHAFSCAARRGGAMNTALELHQLLNRRTRWGMVETRSFSVVEHVWVGCQTERLKVKFDFGLEGV